MTSQNKHGGAETQKEEIESAGVDILEPCRDLLRSEPKGEPGGGEPGPREGERFKPRIITPQVCTQTPESDSLRTQLADGFQRTVTVSDDTAEVTQSELFTGGHLYPIETNRKLSGVVTMTQEFLCFGFFYLGNISVT
ncbi:hypothetical protein RRG08_039478 [Elysia crispata]|uniref:Uncharacterized protein n=1 Tax=Elysia crispata TaxID=231223 RepID=A0AAE0YJY0_9GAST|nr:hypothetical protein RRG08_039478 [Elysia crispata]